MLPRPMTHLSRSEPVFHCSLAAAGHHPPDRYTATGGQHTGGHRRPAEGTHGRTQEAGGGHYITPSHRSKAKWGGGTPQKNRNSPIDPNRPYNRGTTLLWWREHGNTANKHDISHVTVLWASSVHHQRYKFRMLSPLHHTARSKNGLMFFTWVRRVIPFLSLNSI